MVLDPSFPRSIAYQTIVYFKNRVYDKFKISTFNISKILA